MSQEPNGAVADSDRVIIAQLHELPPELLCRVQEELRRLASHHLAQERVGHTLQPTALVNELWIRLAGREDARFESMEALLAFASRVFRSILIDHARRRLADRRGGGWKRVALTEESLAGRITSRRTLPGGDPDAWAERMLELNDILDQLKKIDFRSASVFELRFFGGMRPARIGEMLNVTTRVVRKDWAVACGWLSERMDARSSSE